MTNNIILDPFEIYILVGIVGFTEHRLEDIPDFCIDITKSIKWFGHRVSDTKMYTVKFVSFCGRSVGQIF